LQQIISVWFTIDGRRRVIAALSAIAMFAAIIALSRMATSPGLSLLYAGLEPRTAGQVIQSLEQQGVVFEIRNDAIFVETSRRDQLRLKLAGDGLPANNGQGYEILDNLSGFGTTAQMFDAAYWRAKEGELARTIAASPQFRTARVHISNANSQPFRRSRSPGASVMVAATNGAVSGENARALKFLVSSAVAGMTAADVSVIDSRTSVVVADDNDASGTGVGSVGDRADNLKSSLERLLAARVGAGNVIVEVFLDASTESEAISETTIDPDSRVAISSEIEERSNNSNNSRAGAVTVASNLPTGDAAAGDNTSTSQDSETIERTNYEVSETKREVVRAPGAIKRLSIAVLVDGLWRIDPADNTQTWTPRPDAEMADLRELVASAAGIDEARGDTLTLKTLQFQPIQNDGELVTPSLLQKMNIDVMRLIQLTVLGAVSLVLGLFVLRPIFATTAVPALPAPPPGPDVPALPPAPGIAGAGQGQTINNALTGEIDESAGMPPGLASLPMDAQLQFATADIDSGSANPVERLRSLINDRQDESVEILRNWIDAKGETV